MIVRTVIKIFLAILILTGSCFSASGPSFRQDLKGRLLPAVPLYGPADTVSMIFIGDVMMHAGQIHKDYNDFLKGFEPQLKAADIAVANMEFTLAGKPYTGYPCFSAPDKYADYVATCGVDVFLTANNHILDKDYDGLERTLSHYSQMESEGKIRFTGTSLDSLDNITRYPLIVNVRGVRIALLNFTYGVNNPSSLEDRWPKINLMDTTDIARALEIAREKKPDFIIALPHWGNEYNLRHSQEQARMAKWLAGKGVSAIIGAHPHVIQDFSMTGDVPVYYSLGNAVSNMSAPNTQMELAVELRFTRDENGDKSMLPPTATYFWCSIPGRFSDNYTTLRVKDYIGKKECWKTAYDYTKMVDTYARIKKTSKIND